MDRNHKSERISWSENFDYAINDHAIAIGGRRAITISEEEEYQNLWVEQYHNR